uniref:(northern house mosquito) hypothetical protein n=1 Tax=Culex pipiens TaxID=7175 RepID=A0A8D8PHR5_CULPI
MKICKNAKLLLLKNHNSHNRFRCSNDHKYHSSNDVPKILKLFNQTTSNPPTSKSKPHSRSPSLCSLCRKFQINSVLIGILANNLINAPLLRHSSIQSSNHSRYLSRACFLYVTSKN